MSFGSADYEKKVKRGIRSALHTVIPGMGISSNALRLIAICLSNLDSRMVDQCRKYFARRKNAPSAMPVSEARKAVANTLPHELLPLAEAAANKCVMRYNAGLLQYHPPLRRDKLRRRKMKTASRLMLPEFTKCVPAIARMVDEDLSMQNEARTMVGVILQKVAASVVEKLARESSADKVTSADVVRALDGCLEGNVKSHAVSEGVRTSLLFANDMHRHKTDDFEKVRRNNTKHRRFVRK